MREPVEARGLSYEFGMGRAARRVLLDLDFTVHRGEIVLLTGPSGSGKTTLLTLIGALRPCSAEVVQSSAMNSPE